MPKFLVDLWLDGYNSEKEMSKACKTFIDDQLDFAASDVKIEDFEKELNKFLNWYFNKPCEPGKVIDIEIYVKEYLKTVS